MSPIITLKEIAREAGVSMTTVSNVINGNTKRVSPTTLERVEAIIHQNGYVPNQAARSLAQRESHIVAVIVQAEPGENIFRNPYTAEYVGALTVFLQENGYYPLIRFTNNYRDVERNLLGWNVAGAIFSGTFSRNLQELELFSDVPCVFTDCYFKTQGVSNVGIDDAAGGQLAARHLLERGHREVAFVANDLTNSEVDQHRLAGFRDELALSRVKLAECNIVPTEAALLAKGAVERLLSGPRRPTAVFCTADRIAVQLMQMLKRLRLDVPGDVSVVGFDNLPIAAITEPPLTTIGQDIGQKARLVVDILLRHIRSKELPAERTLLGAWLVERESVRRVER